MHNHYRAESSNKNQAKMNYAQNTRFSTRLSCIPIISKKRTFNIVIINFIFHWNEEKNCQKSEHMNKQSIITVRSFPLNNAAQLKNN